MSPDRRASALELLSAEERRELRRTGQPKWIEPMKATLHDRPFSDPDWIYERKLDGVRCLAFRKPRGVRLLSRTDKPLNNSYPELVEALEREPTPEFIVDGEIVAFSGHITSFSRLQRRMQISDREREFVRDLGHRLRMVRGARRLAAAYALTSVAAGLALAVAGVMIARWGRHW